MAKQRSSPKPSERVTTISTYVRDVYVAEASKRRAKGICQLCEKPAPFNDKNGNPYLECHHIIWLSEGGADEVNVLGTSRYMAPEILARQLDPDIFTDSYSLAVILFELLKAGHPYIGDFIEDGTPEQMTVN